MNVSNGAKKEDDIVVTSHAFQRFISRCLKQHRKDIKNIFSYREVSSFIKKLLLSSKENKTFINNTDYMAYHYDRYGYKKFTFYISEYATFCIVFENGKRVVVTCFSNDDQILLKNNVKFHKNEKPKVNKDWKNLKSQRKKWVCRPNKIPSVVFDELYQRSEVV